MVDAPARNTQRNQNQRNRRRWTPKLEHDNLWLASVVGVRSINCGRWSWIMLLVTLSWNVWYGYSSLWTFFNIRSTLFTADSGEPDKSDRLLIFCSGLFFSMHINPYPCYVRYYLSLLATCLFTCVGRKEVKLYLGRYQHKPMVFNPSDIIENSKPNHHLF